ncbi:ATP-binding response regulator [Burkholderia sp. WAC0059]|uniref:ATP-binding response regulator n=1 Tax=Burkholderia sp. WAC0059 TaxID=2066022 RepID=UPI002154FBE5|nr:ATP-binding protein [Burkholderia sp. WAC0059]
MSGNAQAARPGSLRRIVHALLWLVALGPPVVAIGYLLYSNLINPGVIQRLTSGDDGLYWDAAQLQIAYARFESRLLTYGDGFDRDLGTVRLRYGVLQRKLQLVSASTGRLAPFPTLQQRQRDDLRRLDAVIGPLGPQLDALARDPSLAAGMVRALGEHWPDVNDLALSRRLADVIAHEEMRRDFMAKRRALCASGFVLLLLSAAAAVLLVFNGYRRTRLIRQQHALLAAEHQASRAAREASAAKDAFLGMISHELRTPLHAIVSSIELLGFSPHSEGDHKVIRRLETAARQLEAQMKDLTDYARLGAGKLELRSERFEPRVLLQSIVDQHEAAAYARGLAFESAARGWAGPVESDPHRIRQIAGNLVTNAIRYTERGKVRLEFAVAADTLSIIVGDTGPGVAPAQIPLIFKEFTQLDTSRSRRYEGAGMGLAIVQGLVELFGGTIATDSRVGEGTTFTVTIPVTLVAAPAFAEQARYAGAAGMLPPVLVVDDNPLVRESLREMAEHMGCSAFAAGDADTALALLDAQRCGVVLLDLHMPGRDGYAFMKGLAEPGRAAHAPRVIAVSADGPEAGSCPERPSPFFDYLTKPVHYEELRAAVLRALAVPLEV